MDEKMPKILSVSLNSWRSDSGIHTETDLFKFWDKEHLAQIYTRSDLPNTPVCDNFFQISENAIIKSVFNRKAVGRRVENGAPTDNKTAKAIESENKLYTFAHRKKSWFLTLVREIVWGMGVWKTKALDRFIEEENPDVYFMTIYPVAYMCKLQLYILKKHPRPYVCFLADDNYTYIPCEKNIFSNIHRFFLRRAVKKLAVNCNEMFTITKTQALETDRYFGTKSVVLTKGIDYSNVSFTEKEPNKPIKMVYTGKLCIGRASSLVEIAKALQKINQNDVKIELDIYSADIPDKKTMVWLNSNGCHFKGSVGRTEIEGIQNAADIVVFVESLEKKYKYAARLSFSTKLTDYFKSGKCIFAIGDKSIAPIEYLRDNDAAIIVNSYDEIEDKLADLISTPEKIKEYGKKAFDCGKYNHNEEKMKEVFISAFYRAKDQRCRL